MDFSCHGNFSMPRWIRQHEEDKKDVLFLNVLLLGNRQSGRSSVGNALIGGHEFQTGSCLSGVSMTTECQVLSRKFPGCFRRRGAETDLVLRVIDTPPQVPSSQIMAELSQEGVHVIAVVVRADQPQTPSQLQQQVEGLFGPEWRHHALLVITHLDHLEEAGLLPSRYLSQAADWLRALAEEAAGGVTFVDNSCDWPSVRGRPLRDRLLRLSAKNHHRALTVRTEV